MNKDDNLWIARDSDGYLGIYYNKPKLEEDEGSKCWDGIQLTSLENGYFPSVKFENSPQKLVAVKED